MNEFSIEDIDKSTWSTSAVKLIALHLGASNSPKISADQLKLAKQVCEQVMLESYATAQDKTPRRDPLCQNASCQWVLHDTANQTGPATEAVVRAVELMENYKSLNCGFGSNLSMDGVVECDASLMSGSDQAWTGIGSVSGCRNPIRLAKSLHDHHRISRPLGLVQPNFLVATGARQWMREHCPSLRIPDSHLISSSAFAKYQELKSGFDKALKDHPSCDQQNVIIDYSEQSNAAKQQQQQQRIDTVGAIAVDRDFNFACAVSSGGIMLKHRGRIGQAAVPGAGCWAQNSIATTTTGVGEFLTGSLFARTYHDKLQTLRLLHDLGRTADPRQHSDGAKNQEAPLSQIREAMEQCFKDLLESSALAHVPSIERLAGLLTVSTLAPLETNLTDSCRKQQQNRSCRSQSERQTADNGSRKLYLSYGHNTRSLCIGYMLAGETEAVSFVSRNDDYDKEKTKSSSASSEQQQKRREQQSGLSLATIELACGS